MAGRTRSSSGRGLPNGRARAAVAVGLLSVATLPAVLEVARVSRTVTLLQAAGGIPVAAALAVAAIVLARRAQQRSERTLGRIGGVRLARLGGVLGFVGLAVAATSTLALAFYGLLALFAR